MITFIHPYAFIWLLLAIPLILFYLWRARRPQAQVVTGALWRKAIPLLHPRRAWQKQRWGVSLLVQLALLLVLVTALAEPCWRRPQRVVLILDATTSMEVQNRLADALAQARGLAENLGYVDSMAVLTVSDRIGIHCRMSHDRAQILASLTPEKLKAGGCAPIDEAVLMAKSLITAGTGGTFDPKTNHVILISDGCFPLADRVLKDEAVRWLPVGETVGNVQLETLVAERRTPEKPEEAEIFVSLRNFGPEPVRGTLSLRWKTEARELPVTIPAFKEGGLLTQTVAVTEPEEVQIQAVFSPEMNQKDALPDDNSLKTLLQEAFTYRVTVVTPQEPNTLLENALAALPSVLTERVVLKKGNRLTPSAQAKLPTEPFSVEASGVKRFEMVIFDRTLPAKAAMKTVPARSLFFAPPDSTSGWTRSETVRDYVIMPWMDGLRSGISTAGVGFTAAHALTPKVPCQPWLFSQSALEVNQNQNVSEEDENFAKQAQTVEMTELAWGLPDSRSVLTACDLTQSDWILADDFPRFLQFTFDWMAHTPASDARIARGLETGWQPGETFTDSDLNVPPAPEKLFVFPGEDVVPMWSLLVLLVCGLTVTEWYFYQRRWLE